jgi:hypothetical protein
VILPLSHCEEDDVDELEVSDYGAQRAALRDDAYQSRIIRRAQVALSHAVFWLRLRGAARFLMRWLARGRQVQPP